MNTVVAAAMDYFIVIPESGGEPMAIAARDASEARQSLRRMFGDVALIAGTTRAALLRAGWTDDTICVAGQPMPTEANQ